MSTGPSFPSGSIQRVWEREREWVGVWVCGQKEKFQLWHNDIAIGFSLSQLRLSKHLSLIVHLTTMWFEEELPLTRLCAVPVRTLIMVVAANFLKVKGPQHANSSMAWLVWYYAQVWPRWKLLLIKGLQYYSTFTMQTCMATCVVACNWFV